MGEVIDRRSTAVATAALLGAMASHAVGSSVAKRYLFGRIGPEGATAYRVAFAAVFLAAVWRPWRRSFRRDQWPTLLAYGVSLGAMNLSFYLALRRLPFGPAVALEFLGPLALAIGTSRRASDGVWVALAVVGLGLLLPIAGHGSIDGVGALLAVTAGACWAVYIVFGQRAGAAHGPAAVSVAMAVAAAVVVPVGVARAGASLLDGPAAAVGLAVAALSGVVPYSLELASLARLPKRSFSVMVSMAPAVSSVGGWAVNGDHLTGLQWAAVAVVMAASAGAAATAGRPAAAELAAVG